MEMGWKLEIVWKQFVNSVEILWKLEMVWKTCGNNMEMA